MKKLILISVLALSTWVCLIEKASAQYVTYYPTSSYVYYSGPTVWTMPSYSYNPTYYAPSYSYPTYYYSGYPAYPRYYSYPTGGYYYRSGLLGRRVYYYPAF